MRYYGLSDLLTTASQVTGIDVPTLRSRHVDLDRAILALRAGGGRPVSAVPHEDVAQGCYRLIRQLLQIKPYRGHGGDRLALEATIAYAAARGFVLDLGLGCMHFVQEVCIDGLGEEEALRALRGGLTQRRGTSKSPASDERLLVGCRVALSMAVSDPSPDLARISRYLRMGLERWIERHGGTLLVPRPQHRRTSRGERVDVPFVEDPSELVTTEDIFTRSVDRLTGTHAQIILADPRSSGSAVEREWALRCGKPVFELNMSLRVHPHSDAPPAVTPILIDLHRPTETLHAMCAALRDKAWQLQDARAGAEALGVKNSEELQQLRVAWDALSNEEQVGLTQLAHMSRPYIRGLLSNTSALELASRAQRTALAALLAVAAGRGPAAPAGLSEFETRLLVAAGERMGLAGLDLVATVQIAGDQLRKTYAFSRLADADEADQAIAAAIAHRRAAANADDWS